MSFLRRVLWPLAACGALVVVALLNLRALAVRTPPAAPYLSAARDPVLQQEQRLAGLRVELQARGLPSPIGYRGDVPPGHLLTDPAACTDYYLAQFTLAPLVLDPNYQAYAWCIANFRTLPAPARLTPGWRVARDFGDGLLLLQKETP